MRYRIKWLHALNAAALVVLVVLFACGCSAPSSALVGAADRFVNVTVGPEYEAYVEADGRLTPDEKRYRLTNVETFRAAVAAERGARHSGL